MAKQASKLMKENLEGGYGMESKSKLYYDMMNKGFAAGGALHNRQDLCPFETGADINYSNVGKWGSRTDYGDDLGVLQDVWMSEGNMPGRLAVNMVLFTTYVGGQMCYSNSYTPEAFSKAYAEFIVQHVRDFGEGKVFDLDADLRFEAYYDSQAEQIRSVLPEAVIAFHEKLA